MILLGLYRSIRWSSYRGIEEANKWFWVMSDDTVMDHREILTSGICSFKQRGLFRANSLIWEWHVDLLISVDDCSCPTTHLCDAMLEQEHGKEDNTNLLRVCNTFNKYTLLLLITTGTTVWLSVYINSTGA